MPRRPGHEKIDVACAGLDDFCAACGEDVASPRGALQRGVDSQAGGAALGLRRVVGVRRRRVITRDDEDHAATREREAGFGLREYLRCEIRPGRQRRRPGVGIRTGNDSNRQDVGRPAAKGEAEDRGQDDREDEHPEDGLGLARQFTDARTRQLRQWPVDLVSQRTINRHAASVPSAP